MKDVLNKKVVSTSKADTTKLIVCHIYAIM